MNPNQLLGNPYLMLGANILANSREDPGVAFGQAFGQTSNNVFARGAEERRLKAKENEVRNRSRYVKLAEEEAKISATLRKLAEEQRAAVEAGDMESARAIEVQRKGLAAMMSADAQKRSGDIAAGNLATRREELAIAKDEADRKRRAFTLAGDLMEIGDTEGAAAAMTRAGDTRLAYAQQRNVLGNLPFDPSQIPQGSAPEAATRRSTYINPSANLSNLRPAAQEALLEYVRARNSGDMEAAAAAREKFDKLNTSDSPIENWVSE